MKYFLIIEPYNIVEEVGKRVECKVTSLVVYCKIFIPRMHDYYDMFLQSLGIFYASSLHDVDFNDDKLVDAIVVCGC